MDWHRNWSLSCQGEEDWSTEQVKKNQNEFEIVFEAPQ